jgi:hypothetical protein
MLVLRFFPVNTVEKTLKDGLLKICSGARRFWESRKNTQTAQNDYFCCVLKRISLSKSRNSVS